MDRRIVESLVASDSGSLRVKTLSLGPDELDIEMLPLWIRVVGTTLEHLQLYFGFINQPGIVHSAADCLKNCKSLHTVTLSAGIWNNSVFSVSRPNFWNSTLDVLQVPLQEGFLRTIYIICQSICIRTARSAALKAIDELLTRVSDRRALSVNFSFFNADTRPEEMANISPPSPASPVIPSQKLNRTGFPVALSQIHLGSIASLGPDSEFSMEFIRIWLRYASSSPRASLRTISPPLDG
ncbi:hypothetical protein PHLCEN_2v12184 [Hermanssonia centrifuga]|uniref:Uncharacterized protein n=1 Tax=Hermanssonia centrifuga TaxID=98765 RepID=A0A2R6NHW5_9APHY|nr:hypothetical protein PHLCEN_2v12184 [Hermanssonia centrifuga]